MRRILIIFTGLGLLISSDVFAEEFMTVRQAKVYEKKVRAEGKRFRDVFCQQKGKSYLIQVNRLARVYRNKEWTWAIGHSVYKKNLQLKKKGFKRTYLHTNEYLGRVQCAVWIK